jgi:hypothetical protein
MGTARKSGIVQVIINKSSNNYDNKSHLHRKLLEKAFLVGGNFIL